jgi:hypothetical protein
MRRSFERLLKTLQAIYVEPCSIFSFIFIQLEAQMIHSTCLYIQKKGSIFVLKNIAHCIQHRVMHIIPAGHESPVRRFTQCFIHVCKTDAQKRSIKRHTTASRNQRYDRSNAHMLQNLTRAHIHMLHTYIVTQSNV